MLSKNRQRSHAKGRQRDLSGVGFYLLNKEPNVLNDGFKSSGLAFISESQAEKLNNVSVQSKDILLNITGDSVARSCMVDEHYLPARVNQHVAIIRPNPAKLDPYFLRFFMISRYQQELMLGLAAAGATRNALTKGMIENFAVPCPPIEIQRQIGEVLRTIEERIAFLRQTNETLESIAAAIFKSWFVDFDPVKAKAEGRKPEGMDTATAALFPSEFEESEFGPIPKGWNVKSFIETVDVLGGGTPRTSVPAYWGGDIPWFSVVDTPNESDVFVVDTQKRITDEGLDHSTTRLLPAGTTIISARGTVGNLALAAVPMTMNQSCYGLDPKLAGTYFTYFITKGLVAELKRKAHGSVFDTITRETLASSTALIPTEGLLSAYEQTASPIMERIKNGVLQNRTLSNLRDSLLPKLISGQLRVPEAESLAESAV